MIGLGSTVGNYRVVRKLGSGAMGAVYLAEHPVIGKKVALKVIHADLAENEEMVSRFFNEARAVTQIGHQNIIEVIDFGQSPDGDNFIVMELLEGTSLAEVLLQTPILPLERMQRVTIQIAEGLEASHRRGIVHRDLKPDNIYLIERLGDPDFVKILDFGLAKLTQGGGALSHKTRAGSVLGTPHYMAPEQCEGRPDIDHRVDVYALGCLMYQMLCGRVPFPGDGFGEVLVKHLREPPVVPTKLNPAIPRPFEAIILHALAKRKEFRFQSMKELAQALRDPERHLRELSGDVPLMPLVEPELPAEAPVAPPQVPARPTGPVAKADRAASTLLDELPDAVAGALDRDGTAEPAPPTAAALRPGAKGTLLFYQAKGQATGQAQGPAPAPTNAQAATQTNLVPPSSSMTTDPIGLAAPLTGDGEGADLRPARSRAPRWAAIGVGTVVLVAAGGLAATRLSHHRSPAGSGLVGAGSSSGPRAPRAPRSVVIRSDPPGAEVLRDGEFVGDAPVTLTFGPGDRPASIRLHKDGYVDVQRSVQPDAVDDQVPILVRLRPLEAPASIPGRPATASGDTKPSARPQAPARPAERAAVESAARTSAGAAATPSRSATRHPPRKKQSDDGDGILAPAF